MKCDETKPACQKCTSTGRKCDGYSKEIVITLPNDTQAKAVIQRIHAHVPGSSEEKRGLQYFVTHTAVELSGFYSSSFWEHLILQASAAEPSLRHVVIAIGALHEEFACGRLSYEPQFESKGQIFAYNQYTKAIGHLRRSLATGKQAPLTALMSCILFVCFDSIRGAFESALVHLQSGLKILRDVKAHSKEEEHIIQNSITPLFVRLCVQAILYIDTRSTPARRAFVTELSNIGLIDQETSIPECFENLEEARVSLEKSADGLFRMFYLCDGKTTLILCHPEFDRTNANTFCRGSSLHPPAPRSSIHAFPLLLRNLPMEQLLLKIHVHQNPHPLQQRTAWGSTPKNSPHNHKDHGRSSHTRRIWSPFPYRSSQLA